MWQYVSINPCPSGFGQFQSGERGDVYNTLTDLLGDSAFCADVTQILDEETLPEGAEDIRGRVQNEPDRLFVSTFPDGGAHYFGANAVED
jgi:hypothetical protein